LPPDGAQLLSEIREQPRALRSLLDHEEEYRRVGTALRDRGATTVRMVGHGSSDNAASYGVYAFGLLPRWTALRDSITLGVYYESELDLSGSAVLGLSQSGRTPDVIAYIERARARGAFTIALTNDTASELAEAAEAVLPLAAGPELAIAATKTYLNQVAALALLAASAAERGGEMARDLRAIVEQLAWLIESVQPRVTALANAFAYVGRMFVIGRGVEFATAREIALKLLETCRVAADSLTATDLAHGPVAALDPLFPVWAIASADDALPAVLDAAARAAEMGATLVASGTAAERVADADYVVPVPAPPSPLLAPLLSVVPGQLFAWALARAKGLNADHPAGLKKVTLAR
jgi:glucosamine--fructose-6-phosphate aminotransferase (isomerizing)